MERTRRRARRVFTFNIMVVGATGLGKTTFVRTLTSHKDFKASSPSISSEGPTSEIEIINTTIELNERSVSMSIIDTPGFGGLLDNSASCQNILKYVEDQFRAFLSEERKIHRDPKYMDPRVHAVLYFLDPSGHNLSELDVEFIRLLGRSTNIIPVIGRADCISEMEIKDFKKMMIGQLDQHGLPIYNFPIYSDDEEKYIVRNNYLEDMLPFALVGSESIHEVNGTQIRGRKYPWGIVEVENPQHCDFNLVKDVLLHSHLEVLKEDTHEIHYEYFRKQDLISKEAEKNLEQGKELKKEVLSKKDMEEAEMKARKRRSRISSISEQNGPPLSSFLLPA